MKQKITVLFVCIAILFSGCVFIPKRVGKIKSINNGRIKKGDSVYFINPFYTYATFGNSFTGSSWDKPNDEQIEFEKKWDSVQLSITNEYFKTKTASFGIRGEAFYVRPFKFKVLLGGPEDVKSDTSSWLLSQFTWNVRAGKNSDALKFLPDSIIELSERKPVIIFTNDFYFYEIEFQAYYGSGTTGLNFIPDCLMVIVYKGEVEYFRGYSKRFMMDKVLTNPSIITLVTTKMFDKVK